jgi:phage-related protein
MPDKDLVWLHGEVRTPPFSDEARRVAGILIRLVQRGMLLSLPDSRPMPGIGPRCHELRIRDAANRVIWRVVYRIDEDAVVICDVFVKKTQKIPQGVIDACKRRFRLYDQSIQ